MDKNKADGTVDQIQQMRDRLSKDKEHMAKSQEGQRKHDEEVQALCDTLEARIEEVVPFMTSFWQACDDKELNDHLANAIARIARAGGLTAAFMSMAEAEGHGSEMEWMHNMVGEIPPTMIVELLQATYHIRSVLQEVQRREALANEEPQ